MKVLTLPQKSATIVALCVALQIATLALLVRHEGSSLWVWLLAFFAGGFITDLISGLAHFGFDYVWSPMVPVLGPIAVEFREHHEDPTLDPSALLTNFTKAAYGATPLSLGALIATFFAPDGRATYLLDAILFCTSVWMLGFHQIHSYAHMGSTLGPEEFNRAVAKIGDLPSIALQRAAFRRLFDTVGIPPVVRLLQKAGLFLRPEVHWRHHLEFESDFSSVNGWSDPLTNWIYGPIARQRKATRVAHSAVVGGDM